MVQKKWSVALLAFLLLFSIVVPNMVLANGQQGGKQGSSNDSTWDKSSLTFTGSTGSCERVEASIKNTGDLGDGDMDGPSNYEVHYWPLGSSTGSGGAIIATGTIAPLKGQETGTISYNPNDNPNGAVGQYKFKAYHREGHPGTGELWSDTVTIGVDCAQPSISLQKTVTPTVAQAGSQVSYTFTITNTGNVPLEAVQLNDDKLGANWSGENGQIGLLAKGASTNVTAEFMIPEDATGVWINTANVIGYYVEEEVTDEATAEVTIFVPNPAIHLVKTVDKDTAKAGDTVNYTFVVTNIGNVDLTSVVLVDDKLNTDWTKVIGNLAAGASQTFNEAFTIPTDAKGQWVNTANVSGLYGDTPVTASDTAVVTIEEAPVFVPAPAITLVKEANKTLSLPGGVVTYSFVVTNTGNVDLSEVILTDNKLGNSWSQNIGTLAKGASQSFTVDFTLPTTTFGDWVNEAIVTGSYEGSSYSATDTATVQIVNPSIDVEKTVNQASARAGDTVVYTIVVTNTGTVDLTNVTVVDPMFGEAWTKTLESLAAGQSQTFTTDYVIPAGATGTIENTATATGFYPALEMEVEDSDTATLTVDTTPVFTPAPSIDLEKSVNQATARVGDTVTYSFVVTNNGNVDLTQVIVTDDKLGANWTKTIGTLAIGATVTFTEAYIVPAGATGNWINTATVTGKYNEATVSDTDTATVAIDTTVTTPPTNPTPTNPTPTPTPTPTPNPTPTVPPVIEVPEEPVPLAPPATEEPKDEEVVDEEPPTGNEPPDGDVEVPEEEIPLGTSSLPKTGEVHPARYWLLGAALAALGLLLPRVRRRV